MEQSSFFNSINKDRMYNASVFADYFNSFINNGVFPNPSTNLQVFSNNNMTITIAEGKGWINGYIYTNSDDLIKNIEVADGVLDRIDRVVIQLNFLTREIKIVVRKGTFASTPVVLVLQRDADVYEIAIADIKVTHGTVSITQTDITDLRLNKELCGIVHGTVDQVDTTTLFNQYQDWLKTTTGQATTDITNLEQQFEIDFNNWFETIKNKLDGDVAAKLTTDVAENSNKIGVLNTDFDTFKTSTNEELADIVQQSNANKTDITTINDTELPKKQDHDKLLDDIGDNYFKQSNYGNIKNYNSSHTLTLSDENSYIRTSANITVPTNASVALPINTQITILNKSSVAINIIPSVGITIHSKDTKRTLKTPYSSATLIKYGTEFWDLIGDLS